MKSIELIKPASIRGKSQKVGATVAVGNTHEDASAISEACAKDLIAQGKAKAANAPAAKSLS